MSAGRERRRAAALALAGALVAVGGLGAALAEPSFRVELEAGPAWQVRNDLAVPGDGGTYLRLPDAPRVTAMRAALRWDFGERWSLRLLAAPLSTETSFVEDRPVDFAGVEFPAGEPLRLDYRFDSYRATLLRRFDPEGPWSWRVGGTLKIRDASLVLRSPTTSARKSDLGAVPLLHLGVRREAGARLAFDVELDALGAPQGRAIDAALRAEWRAGGRVTPYLGVRVLDGGADNDEVVTFATVRYLFAGVRFAF